MPYLTAEATEVKIKETVEVDIDFNYVNSTTDKVISETLLDVGFTVETQNVSVGSRVIEIKYFSKFIPANFTQSELNEFVKEANKITRASNPNTVIDDFYKIGVVTTKFLNHGNDSRSKRVPYTWQYYYRTLFETDPNSTFGIGVHEMYGNGFVLALRFKNIHIPIFAVGKRGVKYAANKKSA